jgi:hypothetical protein
MRQIALPGSGPGSMPAPAGFEPVPSGEPTMRRFAFFSALVVSLAAGAAPPHPDVPPPGASFAPPDRPTAPGAPQVFEYSHEAGPDETFFLVGEHLTGDVTAWGPSGTSPMTGQEWKPRVQFHTYTYVAATLPENAPDGVFLVWVKNDKGYSAPVVLNAPQPWFCWSDRAEPGANVLLYGRSMARRPDFQRAFVYLSQPGKPGVWAPADQPDDSYTARFSVPSTLTPGDYEVRVHAGSGGTWGWSGPVKLRVVRDDTPDPHQTTLDSVISGTELQKLLDAEAGRPEGSEIHLPAGTFQIPGTLRIPAHVRLEGDGQYSTFLQVVPDPTARFARLNGSGWNQAPGRVHTPGDRIAYTLDVPRDGAWSVWVRYGTDMKGYNQPGVSGNHTLAIDNQPPVPMRNLENTGSWAPTNWSKTATLNLTAGKHTLTWKNVKGGGISLDAFVFALDPDFKPTMTPPPRTATGLIVLQAEDCDAFETKEGELPGGDRAAVWLSGDGASLVNVAVLGTAQTNIGIAVQSPDPAGWISDCHVERVRIADIDGKQAENCALRVRNVDHAKVDGCKLWGRTPLFLSGARRSEFTFNELVSVTRFGGNAEAAILGRTEPIEECVIIGNTVLSPGRASAGGPTARRLLWFSTGHGSITHNVIYHNNTERTEGTDAIAGQSRFGGVAGTDQNVGEMILFEGNHRTMYFGPLAGADERSVALPKTLPDTPDSLLGSTPRKQLAHDADGHETPFWPPDADDGTEEPPIGEYYVTIFAGKGQGQTRRVVKREGEKLVLGSPWRVAPERGSIVAVGTMFYQNLILNNHTPDGMTGIQLWISCVENVISGNTIARQRKPGLFLYANGTTLASSMPRTWNRGISPLFWNVAEGNRAEECSAGALVTSGDENHLPIEFPRALGNVLRHNSFIRNRTDGVVLTSRPTPEGVKDTSASVVGTVVEFNVVRDAAVAYHAGPSSDATVFRRNHAYFWHPVNNSTNPPVAFQVDALKPILAIEQNSIEGIHGDHDNRLIDLKTPKEDRRLPE